MRLIFENYLLVLSSLILAKLWGRGQSSVWWSYQMAGCLLADLLQTLIQKIMLVVLFVWFASLALLLHCLPVRSDFISLTSDLDILYALVWVGFAQYHNPWLVTLNILFWLLPDIFYFFMNSSSYICLIFTFHLICLRLSLCRYGWFSTRRIAIWCPSVWYQDEWTVRLFFIFHFC